MALKNELLDELLAGRDPAEVFAADGLLGELKKTLSLGALVESEPVITTAQNLIQKVLLADHTVNPSFSPASPDGRNPDNHRYVHTMDA